MSRSRQCRLLGSAREDGAWTEAQSRLNFEAVSRLVVPGQPERSRLLRKALVPRAGGAPFH
ncbi:MAG: hypothetical protein ACE5FA_10505, partial [Dehalococcoidia bacterium]